MESCALLSHSWAGYIPWVQSGGAQEQEGLTGLQGQWAVGQEQTVRGKGPELEEKGLLQGWVAVHRQCTHALHHSWACRPFFPRQNA